jgi:hypothetical protein
VRRAFSNSGRIPQKDNIISAKAVRIDIIKSYHERSEADRFACSDYDGTIFNSFAEVDTIWAKIICEQCGQDHGYRPTFEGVRTSMDIIPELMNRWGCTTIE